MALLRRGLIHTNQVTDFAPWRLQRAADQLLKVKLLAARWSVCTATVYALIEAGNLPALRIQRSIRVPSAAVQAFERQTRP
jgi:excisionase family DNA binding protein